MEIKELLKSYRVVCRELDALRAELKYAEEEDFAELISRYDRLEECKREAERFVSAIDDIFLRSIFEYRYLKRERLSWDQICARMGGINSKEGLRKMHERFLKSFDKRGADRA